MFAALRSLLTPGSRSAPVQHASVVQPPTVHWPSPGEALPQALRTLRCPNCGSVEPKSLTLTIDVQLPDHPSKRLRVLRCPGCTAHIYDSQVPPDYAEPALNDRGRVPFYVEQGAGVGLITKPLAQLRAEPGSAYMEIGCGYGFGLDFAINTRGWRGVGIDPAPLAALGRDALGLPIELRYLREDDEARGTMDVVMGSEVIEHVTDPRAFVRTLRAMLKPGGTLVLTTPNGDDIHPDTPPGSLIPLLSPSLHLTIQNPVSLHRLLTEEGFAHVAVGTDSHSLLAFASDAPLRLETDSVVLRQTYRTHLTRGAEGADPGSDLFLGFAGRAFTESLNDGELGDADRVWPLLVTAVRNRFALDLDAMDALPEGAASCGLERLAVLMPLNLGGLLYAACIRRLAAGALRPGLEGRFLLAAAAAGALRHALGELAMEDGQTEDIGWTARAEAVLCAAVAGSPDVVDRMRGMPPAPTGAGPRRRAFILRGLVGLVNAGHLGLARDLADAEGLWDAPFTRDDAVLPEVERDALFALASLDAQTAPPAALARAAAWLARVRGYAAPGDGLFWDTLRWQAQVLDKQDDADQAAGLIRIALAQAGVPAASLPPDLAERLRDGADDRGVWDARADAALHAAEDGSPKAAARLHRMPVPPGPDGAMARRTLIERALVRLVNARRRALAEDLADREGLWRAPPVPGTESGTDALLCLATLALQSHRSGTGGDVPARHAVDLGTIRDWFAQVRAAVPPGSDLACTALYGEMEAVDLSGATEEAARLLVQSARQPGVEAGRQRRALAEGLLVRLVNAGHYGDAGSLARAEGLWDVLPDTGTAGGRDALLCLAVLALQVGDGGASPADARGWFAQVRAAAPPGSDLARAALHGEVEALDRLGDAGGAAALLMQGGRALPGMDHQGSHEGPHDAGRRDLAGRVLVRLVNAGQYPVAEELAGAYGLWDAPPVAGTPGGRDALFCLGVLALQLQDRDVPPVAIATARGWFTQVRLAVPGSDLAWAALRGELNAFDQLGSVAGAARTLAEIGPEYGPVPDDVAARMAGVTAGLA